jgi:hypothetical protein
MQAIRPVTQYARCRRELLGLKSHEPLIPEDWRKAARALYGDPERYRLYDLDISQMVEKGIFVLGRTCVEACIDEHARAMSLCVSRLTRRFDAKPLVVDLFAGSANLLYHLTRQLDTGGFGLENDPQVHQVSQRNLARLGYAGKVRNLSWERWRDVCADMRPTSLLAIIDPPWGVAYDYVEGLDLGQTNPPILRVLSDLHDHAGVPTLALIKTTDRLVESSVEAIREHYRVLAEDMSRGMDPGFNISYMICEVRKATSQ